VRSTRSDAVTPVAVEPVGNAVRQADAGDRLAREVARVGDDELARVPRAVVCEVQDESVVLGGAGMARHEDRLAAAVPFAVRPHFGPAAALEIDLDDRAELRDEARVPLGTDGGEIAEAMAPADQALVDARELAFVIVERFAANRSGRAVETEAMESRDLLVPPVRIPRRALAHEAQSSVAVDVEDDLVPVVVRVQRMEDVAGFGLEPADVAAPAASRHHSDARA